MSYYDSYSVKKVLAIGASVTLALSAIVVPSTIAAIREDGRNIHARERMQIACVHSGQSLIAGNCVSGRIVKP